MKPAIVITSIICITTLVAIALFLGRDGTILASAIGAICGLGGFIAGRKINP